jgi:hypothetical protein
VAESIDIASHNDTSRHKLQRAMDNGGLELHSIDVAMAGVTVDVTTAA